MNEIIEQQIKIIKDKFPQLIRSKSKPSVVSLLLHEKINIELDIGTYPKAPKIKIPKEMKKIIGKPENFLSTMQMWNKLEPTDVVIVLEEFDELIQRLSSKDALIKKSLMEGILQWASDLVPNEVSAFLEAERGIISEFILSDRGISRVNDWRNGFSKEPSIFGTIKSHVDGDRLPRSHELKVFAQHKINIIVVPPFSENDIYCYDSVGEPVSFKFVEFHE